MRLVLQLIGLVVLLQSCLYAVRYDGPYQGRVGDAETGEPIEGVVVLGEWSTVQAGPGGGVSSYYDAEETVTDKNGEFYFSGKGLRIISNLTPNGCADF